ncbi:MAG TPA: serine hydrolase domain-containing protein [Pseudolysinimonas sp.]|nr:serine hydrolase domain-containing protein [Pseudolysinimonas sp.]
MQLGFVADRLDRVIDAISSDVASGWYYGANVIAARHGVVELDVSIGHGDAQKELPLRADSVFSVFSITKAFINVLVLDAIERGRFALTTPMAQLIPEFAGEPRERATIFHFLTHTTGMPAVWVPEAGVPYDRLDVAVEAVCRLVHGAVEPGSRCDYSPMANHVLLAEAVRRTDPRGRSIRDILREDLFDPLGMIDTDLGVGPSTRDRHIVPDLRGVIPTAHLSSENDDRNGLFTASRNEATWVGASTSAGDLHRFAEMLRNEGSLDGVRILSPRTVALARRNWTGELPNELYRTVALRAGYEPPPAYLGLGFSVRGDKLVRHQFGTLTTPETFGNYGAGSALYWIDPQADITFVALTTGLLDQARNIDRFQRLSDLVVAAAE